MNPLAAAALSPPDQAAAHALAHRWISTDELCAAARERRDRRYRHRVTYSPKLFLPVTNLCRSFCDYCAFRRSPKDPGAHTMGPDEIEQWLIAGRQRGCIEALFCLGDRPEAVFKAYRETLRGFGFASTVDYLVWAGRLALEHGLIPHTNAGVLSADEMRRLAPVNASLGLMLESSSKRLCGKGMPHHRAPDKHPALRLQMTRDAGVQSIPFTSGILIGIGETVGELVESLLAIRALHREYGHVQEVIVQRFRPHADTPMAAAPAPTDDDLSRGIALARLILDDEVTVQAPPNLSAGDVEPLLDAGVNDFGGISPVTPDFINPGHAWPHIERLRRRCANAGYRLEPRLPVHDDWLRKPGFVAPTLWSHLSRAQSQLDVAAQPAPAEHAGSLS